MGSTSLLEARFKGHLRKVEDEKDGLQSKLERRSPRLGLVHCFLPGPHSQWHIGEELPFEGDAVRQERRSEGGLQAQVLLIEPSSGDKLAATSHFKAR